jgi:hypothetical protein
MFRSFQKFILFILLTTAFYDIQALAHEPTAGRVQDRVTVDQTIRFRRGSISSSVRGRIQRGTSHWYRVRAREGQQMAVVLKTGNRTSFTISARNAGILEGADGVRRTLVELPETGEYLIEIGTDATANYTLEVTIK